MDPSFAQAIHTTGHHLGYAEFPYVCLGVKLLLESGYDNAKMVVKRFAETLE